MVGIVDQIEWSSINDTRLYVEVESKMTRLDLFVMIIIIPIYESK